MTQYYKLKHKDIKKKFSFKISQNALKRIKKIYKKNPKIIGLRLNIKNAGCISWIYIIEKIKKTNIKDVLYTIQKINIYVPENVTKYINKIKIDFVKNNLNKKFIFTNLKVKQVCGCGKSFGF